MHLLREIIHKEYFYYLSQWCNKHVTSQPLSLLLFVIKTKRFLFTIQYIEIYNKIRERLIMFYGFTKV